MLDPIEPGLDALVFDTLSVLEQRWPAALPAGVIHADLFPDNVLMLGDRVTGLIDFYFACTDLYAYDLAVLLAAWAFPADAPVPDPGLEAAILDGYQAVRPLTPAERAALPLLGQGACLRFLLSRAQDWIAPQGEGSLVCRKSPIPFADRLRHYRARDAA
jgi:homoserine kinase type II